MADRFVRDVRDCVTEIMKEPKAKCGGQVCQTSSLVMLITVRNSSCGKVMFSQASISHSVHKGGHVWQESMLGGPAWQGGVRGRRDGHCSGRYTSYRNAFLFLFFEFKGITFVVRNISNLKFSVNL